jgi:hypothetical protein
MDKLIKDTLQNMEQTLRMLEARVSKPQSKELQSGLAFRYKEQNIHQAIIQKLALVVSGLNAALVLLEAGYMQELGALKRMLDEFNEDIEFLSLGIIYNDITELHKRYLEAFYLEEFGQEKQERPMIPRKKIRAFAAKFMAGEPNQYSAIKAGKNVSKAYSGFVHGASPHIMDLYGGNPPRFHVRGMKGTPRIAEHEEDLWNYVYRGILSCNFVAKAFGDDEMFNSIRKYRNVFVDYWQNKYGEKKI